MSEYHTVFQSGNVEALEAFQAKYCYAGWLVFFDELPSAPRSVQAAAYKIILDRMIGQTKLHHKVALAAAGNLLDDNAIVNEMGTALRSRMVHIHVESSPQNYINYTISAKYDTRITSYLESQKSKVNNFKQFNGGNGKNVSSDETFCSERTWEFVDRILKVISPNQDQPIPDEFTDLLCGTVGSTAMEFVAYTAAFKDLPAIKDIMTDPANVMIPSKPSNKYLLMGMLVSFAEMDNIDAIMDYVDRFEKEFGFIFVKMLWGKSDKFLDNAKVEKLFINVADQLMG